MKPKKTHGPPKKPVTKASHGGARSHAGRKAGTPNKSTKAAHELIDGIVDFEKILKLWNRTATKAPLTQLGFLCGKELWDRRFGKATQGLNHSGYVGTFDPTKLSFEQLERIRNGEDPAIVLAQNPA